MGTVKGRCEHRMIRDLECCSLWRWRKGAMNQEFWMASENWKKMESPLNPSEKKCSLAWILILTQKGMNWTSDLQNYKIILLWCLKPLGLWYFCSSIMLTQYYKKICGVCEYKACKVVRWLHWLRWRRKTFWRGNKMVSYRTTWKSLPLEDWKNPSVTGD